jgi:DNA topoisomerase-6 subunit B
VANVPEIEDEIELAVREAARDLKSHLKRRQSLDRRRRKREVLTQILPEMADKVAAVTERERPDVEAALARIMNNVGVSHAAENGRATLRVRNHSDRGEDLEITAILDAAPGDPPDGASVVEMDGEWFLSWEPSVGAGETVELAYDLDACASVDLQVDGVAPEKLTIGGTR